MPQRHYFGVRRWVAQLHHAACAFADDFVVDYNDGPERSLAFIF
jgi:hypothetical protein